MASNAATRVFSIPELVEMILVNLSTTELVRAPRICRSTHNAAFDSKTPKQELFLEPRPHNFTDSYWFAEKPLMNPAIDGLIDSAVSPILDEPEVRVEEQSGYNNRVEVFVTINVALLFCSLDQGPVWGKMFVTQPAVKRLTIGSQISREYAKRRWFCFKPVHTHRRNERVTLYRPEGVKVMDVANAIREFVGAVQYDGDDIDRMGCQTVAVTLQLLDTDEQEWFLRTEC